MGRSSIFDLDSLPFITIVYSSRDALDELDDDKRESTNKHGMELESKLSTDQQELVKIKDVLGLRHQDFAVTLGIGVHRLSSYTYGRTASVPSDVMDRARQLLKENCDLSAMATARFSRPMPEILACWGARLATTSNDDIAQYLGVTTMTIYRWRKNETRPDLTALSRYDRIVTTVAAGIKKAVERSSKK